MGRPFGEELNELEATHHWACTASVDSLADHLQTAMASPLLAVGSGGSFTTAAVAATLCRTATSNLAFAVTPQELSTQRSAIRQASVLIATASGSNPDAIGVLKTASVNDARVVVSLCTKANSKLAIEAAKHSNAFIDEFPIPSQGDGFLAVNSLWASSVLLTRAFQQTSGLKSKISKKLATVAGVSRWNTFIDKVAKDSKDIWQRKTTIVLYGPTSYAAAVDVESKLTEAALQNVALADYRHFAHGRHHWIAKHPDQTSVIAFVEDDERKLADRTLAEIPDSVPVFRVDLTSDALGMLKGLSYAFPLAVAAGAAVGIDPGRPGVPSFGRKIYRLNAYGNLAPKHVQPPTRETIAIERKARCSIQHLERRSTLKGWLSAYQGFIENLQAAKFSAVVLDYDGTLCSSAERRSGLRPEVAGTLQNLLENGMALGIATGRGKSVRESLQSSLPEQFWDQVLVGYYNGGQIAPLSDSAMPDGTPKVAPVLVDVWTELKSDKRLKQIANLEGRLRQITVETRKSQDTEECWELIQHATASRFPGRVKSVRSSHSFDVVPVDVSKVDVMDAIRKEYKGDILAIGDMGLWPGNDSELLRHKFALSVDDVSSDRNSCWNLSSPGLRGVEATLEYLSRLKISKSGNARLKLPHKLEGFL